MRIKRILISLIPLILLSVCLLAWPQNTKADGTYAAINTSYGNDGGADQLNFSQGRVWTVDRYGKYIWMVENRSGVHAWTFSNNLGSSWTQGSETYSFLTRGSVAYDSINDKLHVIWTTDTCDAGGGIIYRRYGITRDGSNNITDITREDAGNVNLQLDITGSLDCQEPVALWVNDGSTNGVLVAIWSKTGGGQDEIRVSMRKLSISAADGVAGNWLAPDGTGDSFTNAPAVAADKVYTSGSGVAEASAIVRGGTGSFKNDLYIFVQENHGNSSDNVLSYRASWKSSNGDWSNGWQAPVTAGAANSAGGYAQKNQLITRPVLDTTNDRLYVGWARTKTGGSGDTVSFAYLSSADSPSSTIDAYSALGTHSYAPTLDIAFDNTRAELYVAYVESTTNGDNGSIDYKVYDGTTLGSQTRFYTTPGGSAGADGSADIPILYENRSSNDRLLFAFRINGALPPSGGDPHKADFGYITMPAANSTPAPAATTSQALSAPKTPTCTKSTPSFTPDLFQIDPADTNAKLFFTTSKTSVDGYQISFGLNSLANMYGDNFGYTGNAWILDRTISYLEPNTTYYFKVRANNNCNAGAWSKTVQITTKKRSLISTIISSLLPSRTPTPNVLGASTSTISSCEYTIESGDSLWDIATAKFGSGSKYSDIMSLNQDKIKDANTILKIGWQLKLC